MKRYVNILKILYFLELLKVAKKSHSWIELSRVTGESATSLSRYLHGHVLPNVSKVDKLLPILERITRLDLIVLSKIRTDKKTGFINNQALISDIPIMKLISMKYAYKYADNVDIVISPAADGLPFAALLAEHLGTNIIIVKNKKEIGVTHFIEGTHISEDGRVESFYFPRKLIRKGYRALIVDDVLRTGETHKTIIDMVEKAKARVSGILVILILGNKWKSKLIDIPIDYVIKI